ncbi:hypothetical protein AGMMS50293_28350 [Spirochaetia bacterium]|nr:hypothetical protein AGMMS50293_28350 [Spirochaetia bacterium]
MYEKAYCFGGTGVRKLKMNKLNTKYFWPKVIQVLPTDNFEVYAYFNDGSQPAVADLC